LPTTSPNSSSVNNRTTFAFDALNRQTKITDPLNHSGTTAYDAAGRVTSTTDRDGNVINTSYDADGRETAATWIQSGSTVNNLTFSYDNTGDMLTAKDAHGTYTMGYDALGHTTSEQEPFGLVLTMSYDAVSNRTTVQDSFGGVLTSVYDAADRLTSRKFGGVGQTTLRMDIGYNADNEQTSLTRYKDLAGNTQVGSSAYSYDHVGRVTNIQHKDGSSNLLANSTRPADHTPPGAPGAGRRPGLWRGER
jgi:YD repeat-containing protein